MGVIESIATQGGETFRQSKYVGARGMRFVGTDKRHGMPGVSVHTHIYIHVPDHKVVTCIHVP